MKNPGFWHIRDHIFEYLGHETLEVCRKVSEDWNVVFERLSLEKCLYEFGEKEFHTDEDSLAKDLDEKASLEDQKEVKKYQVKDNIPGWNKAVKDFIKTASLEDLKEV